MEERNTRDRDFGARILMCAPEHFDVSYTINPWMDPAELGARHGAHSAGRAPRMAGAQATLTSLGADDRACPAGAGLPDLVFTANAAVVMDGSRCWREFRYPERQPEAPYYERGFRGFGRAA